MVTPEYTCPWGLKALDLLKSREETDAFKAKHHVQTTPQTFIDGKRVGGYDDLREYLGKEVKDKDAITYKPVIALFGMPLAMALVASWLPTEPLPRWTRPNGSSPSRCVCWRSRS